MCGGFLVLFARTAFGDQWRSKLRPYKILVEK